MLVFFYLVQYSMILEVAELPKNGDRITITKDNLVERAGGVDVPGVYGNVITVGNKLEDRGWDEQKKTYPTFSCSVGSNRYKEAEVTARDVSGKEAAEWLQEIMNEGEHTFMAHHMDIKPDELTISALTSEEKISAAFIVKVMAGLGETV